jgi:uncharacterized protein YuzE
MKFQFGEKADAICLCLDDSKVIGSKESNPGIVPDFNNHNQVVGIESLDVQDRVLRANLLDRLLVEGGR